MALNPPATFLSAGPQGGWTAGGGIEVAFTENLTAKVEYLYVDLGTVSCPAGTSCPLANAAGASTASVSLTESLVSAGINYRFKTFLLVRVIRQNREGLRRLKSTGIRFDDGSYLIHGTNAPKTIGSSMNSGCIRLLNDDVVDLYNRCRWAHA